MCHLQKDVCQAFYTDYVGLTISTNSPGLTPILIHWGRCLWAISNEAYRSNKKRYGCLFTCMITRAIHIEMLYLLEAESFLCAFKRFIAHRGVPIKIFSDNGHNFVKGEQELCKAFLFHVKHILAHYTAPRCTVEPVLRDHPWKQ